MNGLCYARATLVFVLLWDSYMLWLASALDGKLVQSVDALTEVANYGATPLVGPPTTIRTTVKVALGLAQQEFKTSTRHL